MKRMKIMIKMKRRKGGRNNKKKKVKERVQKILPVPAKISQKEKRKSKKMQNAEDNHLNLHLEILPETNEDENNIF